MAIVVRPFIEHKGIRYYRDTQGWRCSPCKGHRRLHTVIWEEANGPIPQGFHLFCSEPERPSLSNIELRSAYAGMADARQARHKKAEEQWRQRLSNLEGRQNRQELAERLGVGLSATQYWCNRFGIRRAKPGRKPKYDERIRELLMRGLRQRDIAVELSISPKEVSRRVRTGELTNLQPERHRP